MARKSLTLVRVGPVTTRSPDRREKAVAVMLRERFIDREPLRSGPRDRVRVHDRPGIVFGAVDPVGVAGQRGDPRRAVEMRRRAPAGTRCCGRRGPRRAQRRTMSRSSRRRTAAQPAASRSRRRPGTCPALSCNAIAACTAATSRASPSMRSLSTIGVMPRAERRIGRGGERLLRAGDQREPGAREDRIARFRGLFAGGFEVSQDRGGPVDAVFGEHGARLGEARRIGDGRPGGDHRRVVARHVGNRQSQHRAPATRRLRAGRP